MPTTSPPLRLKLKLKWNGFKVTEMYWLKSATYADGKPVGLMIAQYRRYLLGKNACVVSAAMSFANSLRERKSVVNQPLTVHPKTLARYDTEPDKDWEPNDPEVGFGFTRETPTGKWVPWTVRLIADSFIRAAAQTTPIFATHPNPVTGFVPNDFLNDSYFTGVNKFLRIIQDYTQYVTEVEPNNANERQWVTEDWDAVPYVEIRSHDVGKLR